MAGDAETKEKGDSLEGPRGASSQALKEKMEDPRGLLNRGDSVSSVKGRNSWTRVESPGTADGLGRERVSLLEVRLGDQMAAGTETTSGAETEETWRVFCEVLRVRGDV